MTKGEVAYNNQRQATGYLREWKVALEWCTHFLPRRKLLIRAFLKGISPTKLAVSVENEGKRDLQEVMTSFKEKYKEIVTARRTLVGGGGLDTSEISTPKTSLPKTVTSGSAASTSGYAASTAAAVSSKAPASVAPTFIAKSITPAAKQWQAAKAPITCFNCGQVGHIKPNCPLLTPAPGKKLGSMRRRNVQPVAKTPVIMLEVKGEPDLIMQCAVDTGAEINLVSEAWLSTLNLIGYAQVDGPPVQIEWVADAKFSVSTAVLLKVQISGTHQVRETMFFVAPKEVVLEGLLIGWEEIQNWCLLPHLEGVMVLQREMGLLSVAEPGDGNMFFSDLDGSTVETDELLWPDLKPAPGAVPKIGEVFTPEERVEVEALLLEFKEVFDEELPRGGADVEPLHIQMVEGWTPDNLQPARRYAPLVQAAMNAELETQALWNTVKRCRVHLSIWSERMIVPVDIVFALISRKPIRVWLRSLFRFPTSKWLSMLQRDVGI
jgi:hypothetical protein